MSEYERLERLRIEADRWIACVAGDGSTAGEASRGIRELIDRAARQPSMSAKDVALKCAEICQARANVPGADGQDTQLADFELRYCAEQLRAYADTLGNESAAQEWPVAGREMLSGQDDNRRDLLSQAPAAADHLPWRNPRKFLAAWTAEKHYAHYLGVTQFIELRFAAAIVKGVFDKSFGIYLVGSALKRRDWRDVDVRQIISDEEFSARFGEYAEPYENNRFLRAWNLGISAWMSAAAKLPVDYQVQPQTKANELYPSKGNPRNGMGLL